MKVVMSNLIPRFELLCRAQQTHTSLEYIPMIISEGVKMLFFLLSYMHFQVATKLLGHKYLLVNYLLSKQNC